MADGTSRTLPADKANAVWLVLNGEVEPLNELQEQFCLGVKRIYLNRSTAPDSYLQKFPDTVDVPMWYNK